MRMTGKKILIITYYWPPSGGVGVQRWVHFALNLKKLGWEPIVYTPANPQFEVQDKKLLARVEEIETVKTPIWEPFDLFHRLTGNRNKGKVKQGLVLEKSNKSFKDSLIVWIRGNILIPDPRKFWRKPSVKFLNKYISEHKIDTIVTTGPPHSMHLIGLDLKKNHHHIKWIADFRDPWSNWDVLPKIMTGKYAHRKHVQWEMQVLKGADLAITVSPSLAEQLSKNSEEKVEIIYNGVDTSQAVDKVIRQGSQTFNIGYFGLLNELRDPDSLWQAVKDVQRVDRAFNDALRLVLGGIISESITDKLLSEAFFKDKVEEKGYLAHEEVFAAYQNCDVLILLLNKTDNAKWILPQKFFEYLTASKPILAIGPEGTDLQNIMSGLSIGEYFEDQETEAISKFIFSIFAGNYTFDIDSAERLLTEFSRANQSEKLVKLISDL
jgi:hypothetical protein